MPRSRRPLLRLLPWAGGAAIVSALATTSPAAAAVLSVAAPAPAHVAAAAISLADATVPTGSTGPAAPSPRSGSPAVSATEDPYGAGMGPTDVAVGSGLVLAVALAVRLATRAPAGTDLDPARPAPPPEPARPAQPALRP